MSSSDYHYLLPETKRFLFAVCNAFEKCHRAGDSYEAALSGIVHQFGYAKADEYIHTLIRHHYLTNDVSCLPTEMGLHYRRLERLYWQDRYIHPAAVAFLTTLATMAATNFVAGIPSWLTALCAAIQSAIQ